MNPEEIIDSIRRESDEDADGAQFVLDWWREEGFGEPRCTDKNYCIVFEVPLKSTAFTPFAIQQDSSRALYVYFDNIKATSPFDVDENWLEFHRRLNAIPGNFWNEAPKLRFASAKLSHFANAATRKAFFALMRWSVDEVKRAS